MGRGRNIYINCLDHITKMAATTIYGKNLKTSSLEPEVPMVLKLSMQHPGLEVYNGLINYDPGLTLTYFTARSNLAAYAF